MKQLKITLMSDLCVGSGQNFSSYIDTDICYDDFGLPYIPARRLKGTLKEIAQYIEISNDIIQELFGKPGMDDGGILKISNAHIKDYDSIYKAFLHAEKMEQNVITELFTYVRSQTAIEENTATAKENSLRFTRVIKQYSPFEKNKRLVFYSDIECDKYEEELKIICKCLRNIGIMRTRGLGAVQCALEEKPTNISNWKAEIPSKAEENVKYKIDYTVILQDSLVLPGNINNKTRDYIPGTNVLGAFAGIFNRIFPRCHEKQDFFEDMFLKGNIQFSNLYLSDENGNRSVPAPMFVGKMKSLDANNDGKIKSIFDAENVKWIDWAYLGKDFTIKKVLTERTYHHTSNKDKLLYTQMCISPNQIFGGHIICKGKFLDLLLEILQQNQLRFGRSKTAQYSKCLVTAIHINKYDDEKEPVHYQKGDNVIVALESDLCLVDQYGNYSIQTDTLINTLTKVLGISKNDITLTDKTRLNYEIVGGYNSKWNMKKPQLKVFSKGSIIIWKAPKEITLFRKYNGIGERNTEGYGYIRLYHQDEICFKEAQKDTSSLENEYLSIIKGLLEEKDKIEQIRQSAVIFAEKNKGYFTKTLLNASLVGRVNLMIEEAETFEDLKTRVLSIKENKKQEIVLKLINQSKDNPYWKEYCHQLFLLAKYYLREER